MRGVSIGEGTLLPPIRVTFPHQLSIGQRWTIESNCFFRHSGWDKEGPSITIGDRVFLGVDCHFLIESRISIGSDCNIAEGCCFIDFDHSIEDYDRPLAENPLIIAPIVVEDDVWLGAGVKVLKGVTIGRGAVVGAGAVVTKGIPAGQIWAGVPAKHIGERGRSLPFELSGSSQEIIVFE
jgi:acetyltransferase-like isoleucine patch superfamily enzyme